MVLNALCQRPATAHGAADLGPLSGRWVASHCSSRAGPALSNPRYLAGYGTLAFKATLSATVSKLDPKELHSYIGTKLVPLKVLVDVKPSKVTNTWVISTVGACKDTCQALVFLKRWAV